jgi:hypothetical protein
VANSQFNPINQPRVLIVGARAVHHSVSSQMPVTGFHNGGLPSASPGGQKSCVEALAIR